MTKPIALSKSMQAAAAAARSNGGRLVRFAGGWASAAGSDDLYRPATIAGLVARGVMAYTVTSPRRGEPYPIEVCLCELPASGPAPAVLREVEILEAEALAKLEAEHAHTLKVFQALTILAESIPLIVATTDPAGLAAISADTRAKIAEVLGAAEADRFLGPVAP